MCDCNNKTNVQYDVTPGSVVYNHNECRGITVDLLRMYLNPVLCCLEYRITDRVFCTEEELLSTRDYLQNYISAKISDPETCEFKEQLPAAQIIASRIISTGICI